MNIKVKALTLNEMVVVMIITTIVMGLAFTVLTIVQRHMWSIQHNINLKTEFNRLEEVLWFDTNNYNSIKINEKTNTLEFKTVLDSIHYQFKRDMTIRDRDTFMIPVRVTKFFFNGERVKSGKIDALSLELSKQNNHMKAFVFKINDAKQFID